MNMKLAIWFFGAVALLHAQGTSADYARAQALREKFPSLAIDVAGPVNWIGDTGRFWYRKTVPGGHEFVLVDAATGSKKPAFDHARIAASLSAAGPEYKAATLPFSDITFVDNESAIEFVAAAFSWKCMLADSTCKKGAPAPAGGFGGRGGRGPDAEDLPYPSDYDADLFDYPQQTQGGERGGRGAPGEAAPIFKISPDEKWEALIQNYNIFIRPKGKADSIPLSLDGSEGNYYTLQSVAWSPDSTHLAAYRVRPGYDRQVYYVESSPTGQIQPKHSSRFYRKPGDAVDIGQPVLFDVVNKKQYNIDSSLFPNPFALSRLVWWKDNRGFTFQYNQRGHQMYRVIEVDAANGNARALITEESKTFIDYSPMLPNPRGNGSLYRHDVNDGKEIVWSSDEKSVHEEGCLSIPEFTDEVERPEKVKARFLDLEGRTIEVEAEGLFARVLQHEIDHINGVLFIDHLSKLKRDRVEKKFVKGAKREAAEYDGERNDERGAAGANHE